MTRPYRTRARRLVGGGLVGAAPPLAADCMSLAFIKKKGKSVRFETNVPSLSRYVTCGSHKEFDWLSVASTAAPLSLAKHTTETRGEQGGVAASSVYVSKSPTVTNLYLSLVDHTRTNMIGMHVAQMGLPSFIPPFSFF